MSAHWTRPNVARIATREAGVALHIGADDGNKRLPLQPGEKSRCGLAGFDGELFLDVGYQVVEMRLDKRVHTVGIDCIHETPPR